MQYVKQSIISCAGQFYVFNGKAGHRFTDIIQSYPMVFIYTRDHPQMVRLSRMPGEFSISDIRESFIRQFTGSNSGLNLVVDTQDQNSSDGTSGEGVVLSPQVRSTCLKLTKSPKRDTRCGGAVEKKMAICGIIR